MPASRRGAVAALLLVGCGKVVTGAEPPDGGGLSGGGPVPSEGGVVVGHAGSPGGDSSSGGSTAGGSPGGAFGGSAVGGLAGSGGAGGVVVLPDPDGDGGEPARIELPPRPTRWAPGFPLGSPGWRGSTVPFCSEDVGELQPHVWSGPTAVYVLVTMLCNGLADDVCNVVSSHYEAQVLYRNDGAGWKDVLRQPEARGWLTGFADGSAVVTGGNDCPVEEVPLSGQPACLSAGLPPLSISAARATGQTLYILASPEDDSTEQVWSYEGSTWTKLWSGPLEVSSIAAGGGILVGAGENQAWTFEPGEARAALPGTPAASYGSVWTNSAKDLYLANGLGGVAHYDGTAWTTTDTSLGNSPSMWGAPDGTLFLAGIGGLSHLERGVLETLSKSSTGDPLTVAFDGLWGNSASEIFLTVTDGSFSRYTCGDTFLVWFDGKAFHQF